MSPMTLQIRWKDGLGLFALAVAALLIGLVVNAVRPQPLPLRYESPAARLEQTIHRLGGGATAPIALPEISLPAVRSALDQGKALLLDARAPLFYEHSHLPGALPLSRLQFAQDYSTLKQRLTQARRRDQLLIVYCSGEDCNDSVMVAATLTRLGHPQVHLFRGGYAAWKNAGLSLEPGR